MKGLTSQLPPASLQSKEVRLPHSIPEPSVYALEYKTSLLFSLALSWISYKCNANVPYIGAEGAHWSRAIWPAHRGSACCWLLG